MDEKKILSFSMTSFWSVTFFPSIRRSFGTFEVVVLPLRSFIWRSVKTLIYKREPSNTRLARKVKIDHQKMR